ncbi:hypothetical protein, partial [Burkholderia gladioli]|uniref:hypothetical protein n=1 Tax=Burkholderia gladioli TaxID=28095 RepID=UPI001640AFE5
MVKKIYLIFLCCFISDAGALAESKENKIVGDFEDVGKPGYIRSELVSDGIDIQYCSSSLRKTLTYHVENFDECSMMGVYVIPRAKLLVIDGSLESISKCNTSDEVRCCDEEDVHAFERGRARDADDRASPPHQRE